MKICGIILSGGVGSRMGLDVPKQYVEVCGRPVISYCLETIAGDPRMAGLVIAVAPAWRPFVESVVSGQGIDVPVHWSVPGETRQETIYNALQVASRHYSDDDIVMIHDAARPLVSRRLIDACIDACQGCDGAMPVLPVKDTVYQSTDGKTISSLLPRETLYAGQAPEAFRLGKYLRAHESMSREELMTVNGSSELAYKQGLDMKLIPGEESNFKITTPEDLRRFEQIIRYR